MEPFSLLQNGFLQDWAGISKHDITTEVDSLNFLKTARKTSLIISIFS